MVAFSTRGGAFAARVVPPIVVAVAVTISTLWMAGFGTDGVFNLAVFLIPPVALGLVWVNARLFPRELDLLWLPPDPTEGRVDENADLTVDLTAAPSWNAAPIPAPWAPRFQTIEPPITFAGVAITVLVFCVFTYHAAVAIHTVVIRFTAPPVEAVLDTDNLPITVRLDDDAMVVDSRSDALWTCMMIVLMDGQTVTSTVEIPPQQLLRAARATLSATCDDGRGIVRAGNLR